MLVSSAFYIYRCNILGTYEACKYDSTNEKDDSRLIEGCYPSSRIPGPVNGRILGRLLWKDAHTTAYLGFISGCSVESCIRRVIRTARHEVQLFLYFAWLFNDRLSKGSSRLGGWSAHIYTLHLDPAFLQRDLVRNTSLSLSLKRAIDQHPLSIPGLRQGEH